MPSAQESKQAVQAAEKALREARHAYAEATAEPYACSVCGVGRDDADYLTEVIVTMQPGEEGYQEVKQYRCDAHDVELVDALYALGFRTHEHGGTAMLPVRDCPGEKDMNACPTPTYYGPVTITEIFQPQGGMWQDPRIVSEHS